MNVSREGITPRRGNALASRAKAKQACPGIDRIVENLFTALTRAGAGKVEAEVPDRPVRLAVDENEIDKVFATLSDAVARGAVVTIFGGLVRIETGEAGDKGCALLSVSVTGGQRAANGGVRDALSAVRGLTRKYSGFLRLWERHGEMRLSLYLPVLH